MKRESIFLTIGIAVVAITLTVAGINYTLVSISKSNFSNLTLENIESYTGEGEQGGGYDCLMEKDDCEFKVETIIQFKILKRMPSIGGVEMGGYVDLSAGTQLYYKPLFFWPWEKRLRCGQDITCNKYLQQLGLIN
ncbi:MAG: hypothetical protein LBD59_11420 [Prevotellaceae bacterium]|jgi:hypothetical protein|nr:hypothetical protein [Prevotellaceae bacterium]